MLGIDASDLISVDDVGDINIYAPSAHPSEYGISYSYRTPVPNPASWFREEREDVDVDQSQKDDGSSEEDDDGNLEMVIIAGTSGHLQRGKQEVGLREVCFLSSFFKVFMVCQSQLSDQR